MLSGLPSVSRLINAASIPARCSCATWGSLLSLHPRPQRRDCNSQKTPEPEAEARQWVRTRCILGDVVHRGQKILGVVHSGEGSFQVVPDPSGGIPGDNLTRVEQGGRGLTIFGL